MTIEERDQEQKKKWEQRNVRKRRFGWTVLDNIHQKTKNLILEQQKNISEKLAVVKQKSGLNALENLDQKTKTMFLDQQKKLSKKILTNIKNLNCDKQSKI